MGWWLASSAPGLPAVPQVGSAQSVTTALIEVLGAVVVALVTIGLPLLVRRGRTSESPPAPDPLMGERLAVLTDHDQADRLTLAQLDRHVDGIGDNVDRLSWQIDDHDAQLGDHRRQLAEIRRHLGLLP